MKCSEQSLNRVKLHCSTWSDGAACGVNLDSSFPESIRASQCSERVLPEIPATGKLRKLGWGDHLSQREGVGQKEIQLLRIEFIETGRNCLGK